MKKICILILAILMMGNILAQENETVAPKGWYGRVGVGGGIGLCFYDPCEYYNQTTGTEGNNKSSVNFRPGNGFNGEVGVGYRFNQYVSAELNVNGFMGLNTKTEHSNEYAGIVSTEITKYRGSMLQVIPSVMISPGLEKIDPYARFGLVIGAYPCVYEKENQTSGNNTTILQGVYYGGVPVGYDAALGVNFPNICKHFDVFGEVVLNGINYTPRHYKMTKYEINGVDHLGDLPTKQTHIDFVRSFDPTENIPSTSPDKQLKESFPFSNAGINIGFRYRF